MRTAALVQLPVIPTSARAGTCAFSATFSGFFGDFESATERAADRAPAGPAGQGVRRPAAQRPGAGDRRDQRRGRARQRPQVAAELVGILDLVVAGAVVAEFDEAHRRAFERAAAAPAALGRVAAPPSAADRP